jgi:hypothetical protein
MWIPIDQSLIRHPKVKKLSRLLKISKHEAIGYLVFLWSWCLEFAQDGNITKYEIEDISDGCEWEGEPEDLISALIDCKLIIKTEKNELLINDWSEYAGKCFKDKEKTAERQKKFREKQNVTVMSPLRNDNVTVMSPLRNALDKITSDKITEDNIIQEEKLSEEVEGIYSKLTGNQTSPSDFMAITKVITSLDAPKERNVLLKIIKNCISSGVKYKQKKNETIGSFNYFSKSILSEFQKIKNSTASETPGNGKKQQWIIDTEEDPFLTPEEKELILSGQ